MKTSELITKPSMGQRIASWVMVLAFAGVGIFCFINLKGADAWITGGGLVIIAIYTAFILPGTLPDGMVSFEFPHEDTIKDFKVTYKGKEVKVKYKVNKEGGFEWADPQGKLDSLSFADGSSMNLYLDKYRVLNYLNMVFDKKRTFKKRG